VTKHSSLFRRSVSDEEKSFKTSTPEMSAFGIAFLAGLYSGGLRFPDSGIPALIAF
jgi:hypothetical protein